MVVTAEVELFGEKRGRFRLHDYSMPALLANNLMTCTGLYRKSDFDRVGGYKDYMKGGFEDWDFWISLMEKGGKVERINKSLIFYRIKQKSMSKDALKNSRYLKRQIILHHPDLYLEYYGKIWRELYEIKNSRLFFFFKLLDKFVHPKKYLSI